MNIESLRTYPEFNDVLRLSTKAKIKDQLDIDALTKKFKKAGGKIIKVKSNVMDKKNRTAKENGAVNYANDVINGKDMSKPLNPKA